MLFQKIRAWLVRYLVLILAIVASIGVLGTVVLGGLYLGVRDDLAASIAQCNTDKALSIAKAERRARKAVQAAADRRVGEIQKLYDNTRRALEISEEGRTIAVSGTAEREARIRQLELEGETDDIPDSFEALNVFVPNCALDWVRMRSGDRTETGNSGSGGADEICSGAEKVDGADPFTATFSPLTYSDTLILWGRDRDGLEACNADKLAIAALNHKDDT